MDINQQLQPIVASLIADLKGTVEKELRAQVTGEVIKTIAATELTSIINELIGSQVKARLDRFDFAGTSEQELQKAMRLITDQVNKNLSAAANKQINEYVSQRLAQIDISGAISEVVQRAIGDNLKGTTFPDGSIPHSSVNFTGLKITGDAINGGIISNFGSTGIEDRASFVQLTLMDHASAFEGPIFAPSAAIKGNLTVDGLLSLNGGVDTDSTGYKKLVADTSIAIKDVLNTELFTSYSDIIFNKIQTEGIDLDRITQGGRELVNGNRLGYHIVDTNIQRVGVLNDLQTSGENLFVDTLYVTKNRIGINTMDPSTTVSIWDQEVEITVSKHSQDIGYINTPRNQRLIIGANNKQNLTLDPDGSVHASDLHIDDVKMTASNRVPDYSSRAGHIVWNSAPSSNSPIGWVCLGESRWAKFGKIE